MSSLLQEDYNAINYNVNYYTKLEIDLPKGNLGVELEKGKFFTVVEIYEKSKVKDILKKGEDILKKGDEIFSLNDIILEDKTVDEVELLFYKNILLPRKIVIFR